MKKKSLIKTFEEFSKCKSFTEIYETKVCSRCGGCGEYSFNMMDGSTCYGCGGSGKKFTSKSKKAISIFKELQKVDISDIAIGDKVEVRNNKFLKVENIKKSKNKMAVNDVEIIQFDITCLNGSYVLTTSGKIRKAHTMEDNYKFYLESMK